MRPPDCAPQQYSCTVVSCCSGDGYYWNGTACETTVRPGKCGCYCKGPDRDKTFATREACEARYEACLGIPARKLEALLPSPAEEPEEGRKKSYRIGWAKLLARVFETEVKRCPHCGGERTIRAWITEHPSIGRILGHWELSPEVPTFAAARAPPQPELFEPW